MDSPVIGFAGMTHLGLNSGAAAAERGFEVVCFDRDSILIGRLRDGYLPVAEPGLDDAVRNNADRLTFSADDAVLRRCDVVYVAPDVPTGADDSSDLAPVLGLIEAVDNALDADTVLVLLSQVPPGFTRGLGSQRRHLYYQVETLIFGQAQSRALHPERFIVGCADPASPLPDTYRLFLEAHDCPILTMRYESAELAKISINCCLVAHISVANTLADLCERIGADWSEIVPALRLDRRIGPHAYLVAGLGLAGGNLERDLTTIIEAAARVGTDATVVRAFVDNSAYRKDWVLQRLHELVLPTTATPKIGLLGLAYKQDTNSTKNSPAIALLRHLTPFPVTAYDPAVAPSRDWHPELRKAADVLTACEGADVVAVMTPWPEFADIQPTRLADVMSGNIVLDPLRVLDGEACRAAGLVRITIGAPPDISA